MDYLILFIIGLLVGALISFLIVRNNPKYLSLNAKKKIEAAVGKATGLIKWTTLTVAVMLIMPALIHAQTIVTWYPVEKGQWKTMGWDPVTTLVDNDPLPDPAEATLSYNVYVKSFNTGTIIPIATGITETKCEMILPKRGRYLGGVEAQLLYAGEMVPVKSEMSWSDDSTVCQGGQTFAMKFQTGPQKSKGLR